MPNVVTAAAARGPSVPSRRFARPPYGILLGPFIAGAAITLIIAAGTRQPITAAWVLAAVMVGATMAAMTFARTLWRHEPHVVAGARARARSASAPPPVAPDATPAGVELSTLAAAPPPPPPPAMTEPPPRAESSRAGDPLAHIHAVEDQGRRLRRDCVNCGTPVPLKSDSCPNCGHQQVFKCKGCQTPIRLNWSQCPECGREVH